MTPKEQQARALAVTLRLGVRTGTANTTNIYKHLKSYGYHWHASAQRWIKQTSFLTGDKESQ